MKSPITVQTIVKVPVEKAWEMWTNRVHIKNWYHASDDWHVPFATNELKVGGKFVIRMASKDGKNSFDFGGTYTIVDTFKKILFTMDDGRNVIVEFIPHDDSIQVVETFDPEEINSFEMQRDGWQAILENFKKYAESH